MTPFDPPLAAASLSGEADADWALTAAPHVGCAILGGIALDEPSRTAARELVERDRSEFLPADPLTFVDDQLTAVDGAPLRAGVNLRAADPEPIRAAAAVCADHDAVAEINAHCRQPELRAVGCGEALLADGDRLRRYVRAAAGTGATVSVKLRTEVEGVDLPATARAAAEAGADWLHVDAMDSEPVVGDVVEALRGVDRRPQVIANNGVRTAADVREYRRHGADAVSVGRPSRNPDSLARIADAVAEECAAVTDGGSDR